MRAGPEAAQTDRDLVVARTNHQRGSGQDQVSSREIVFSKHFPGRVTEREKAG